jgi:general secretion pathway protein N
MRRRLGLTVPVLLLGVCVALGYVVVDELGRHADTPPAPNGAAAPEKIAPLPKRTAPRAQPIKAYSETLRRPLFDASRKPPPPAPSGTTEAPSAESPTVKLVGVVILPEGRSALIRVPSSVDLVEVSVGERIDGWRLEAIETDRIVLKSGKASAVYRIDAELR